MTLTRFAPSSPSKSTSALGVNLAMPLNRAAAPLRYTVEVGADISLAHCGGAVVA